MNREQVLKLAQKVSPEMIEIRHAIHRHPEMGWHEVKTSDLIETKLRSMGYSSIRRGFGGTQCGVVCDINPGAEGPCAAIRADIDALAVSREDTGLDYSSEVPGVMHACGHDAHAAILLGVAKALKTMENQLPGTVRLMFQPSEEQAPTPGAKALIKENVLDGVDAVIGFHVKAGLPEGVIGVTPGVATTSGDIWELDVIGKGGHGSRPHLAIDPTVAAAAIISSIQTIVSREIEPGQMVVISIGTINCGTAVNVIPEKCTMTGNIRTTNPKVRATLPERLTRIAKGLGMAYRCQTDFRFIPVYPSIINDVRMVALLKQTSDNLFGVGVERELPTSSGSDDFNFYSTMRPSVYFNIGMGDGDSPYAAEHHSPQFRTNDAIIERGIASVLGLTLNYLEKGIPEK